MASIKIKLKDKPTKEGLFPIVISIIKERKTKVIALGIKCLKKDWDEAKSELKRTHKNYFQQNIVINQKKDKALKIIYDFELENIDFTLTQFEERFRGVKDMNITVKSFWRKKISDLNLAGRTGNARAYRDTMNSFFKFAKNEKLMFREITVEMLDSYEIYLRSNGSNDGGIGVKMRELKALINDAIKKGIVAEKYYPFKIYKTSKLKGNNPKRALTRDEIQLIEELDENKYPHLKQAKQLFIFSYYTRGMNFYDILKLTWQSIEKGTIIYTRSKTKSNFRIKILPPVQDILDELKNKSFATSYIFPLLLKDDLTPLQIENRKAKTLKKYNKDLKLIAEAVGITQKLTSYVARHSFATNLKELGESTEIISQAMGHTDIKITMAYLKDFGDDVIDKSHEKLLREAPPEYSDTNINQRLAS
ncbi:site-specific integrase [Flavobacterium sp. LaA7.5]|nr:site-specific integrase [Flavobacterium salilacus subsp. altitudinum]